MTRPELAIVALIYVAALVLGQRAVGVVAPAAQEAGFAIAAIAGAAAAALLYQRRTRERAPARVKFSVGLLMALLAGGVGVITYVLWFATLRPRVALPVAAAGTLLAPFVVFPLMRPLRRDGAL